MRIVLGLVFLINILFSAGVSLEDMQKYQQYKSVLEDSNIGAKEVKEVKTEVAVNNIVATDQEIKTTIQNQHEKTHPKIPTMGINCEQQSAYQCLRRPRSRRR